VDDHRVDPGVLEQRDVLGEGARQRRRAHRGAAELDHDDAAPVLLHERQGLDQGPGLRDHALADLRRQLAGGHVVYSALIFT
jgi:hypothetical protein